MSTPTALWKKWEGRLVDGKFPLRQWLGSSDHSAVFLTERSGGLSRNAAVKFIRSEKLNGDAQLSRWADAAKLSHPHLIRLFECGRCEIDGTRLLYVVMEYAEENLSEILPVRPLSPEEASEMLRPTAEALDYLHQSGFAHGRIKPSNIMAVDNQLKISADSLRRIGEHDKRESTAYDAPEVAATGVSPAADMWSLGATLVAVMTQEKMQISSKGGSAAILYKIPQPYYGKAQRCLRADPRERCTAGDILRPPRSKRWIAVPVIVVALFLLAWVGSKFMAHQPAVPTAETRPASAPPAADTAPAQSPAPFSEKENKTPAQKGLVRGHVLEQVLPDVSRNAQNTITGHVRVSVEVSVDASGNVSQAKFVSAGPSKYFADRALAAAHRWKFTPPQVDGQAAASEWVLRFQFGRTGTEVVPAEIKP
jgi:TonB family protein